MPELSTKTLLEAGVHFGHQTHRWNPQMAPYIFGERSGVHIIDLEQTLGYLFEAQKKARSIAASGGKVLFVGTKRQGKDSIKAAAIRCHMPYVTERWLGGMMTNWNTIETRLQLLERLTEEKAKGVWDHFPKKEIARKNEELARLQMLLGGIAELTKVPDAMYISDVMREDLALAEGRRLKMPIIGVLDTNADPRRIDYPIPANDDAVRSIAMIAEAIADAVLEGAAEYAKAAPVVPVGEKAPVAAPAAVE